MDGDHLVLVFLSLLLPSVIIIDKLTITFNPYMPQDTAVADPPEESLRQRICTERRPDVD